MSEDGDHPETAEVPMINIIVGASKSHFRWSDRKCLSWADFGEVLADVKVGKKDGQCYTPALLSGMQRRIDFTTQIDVAVLDADCGHDFEEIKAAVQAKGWCAIIHSTFSHLSDRTLISADAFDKWVATEGNDGDIRSYMLEGKGYLPRILEDAEIIDELTTDSRSYMVKHAPCPKFRVILLLTSPWFAEDYDSQTMANMVWRERIGALASALRLHHDQSCTDTSRLYYFPRITEGQEFLHAVIEGERCPLWTLPEAVKLDAEQPAPLSAPPPPGPRLVKPEHRNAFDANGEWVDLTEWVAKYGERFEIEKAIRARAPGMFGQRRSGPKQHLECPNNGDHITGGVDKTGTFVVDASKAKSAGMPQLNSGFIFHCSHNGCSGTDRLHRIAAMLDAGKLSVADLTDAAFLTPEEAAVDFSNFIKPKAKVAIGEDLHNSNIPPALYADLPGVLGEMHAWTVATSHKPQPPLILGAMLAFMAASVGRKVKLQKWNTRPNIYVLGTALSGSGKERSLSAIKDMAKAAGLFEKIIGVEDVASDSGIVTSVIAQPSQVMMVDEVSYLISSANSKMAGPHVVNIISTLLKLYSSSHTVYKGKSYADEIKKVRTVDQPCLSVYGCCVPDRLFSALSSRDITGGLLSRMVLFDAGSRDEMSRAPTEMPVPQVITDWLLAWDRINPVTAAMSGAMPVLEQITVMMSAEASEIADAFEIEMHSAKLAARKRGMDALYVRGRENALKFALIRACAVAPLKGDTGPVIDETALRVDGHCMRWACDLSRATITGMDKGAQDKIADSPFEIKCRNLLEEIKKGGERGLTLREMRRTSAGKLSKNDSEDVITTLSEARLIYWCANLNKANTEKRGNKRDAFVHSDFINFIPNIDE